MLSNNLFCRNFDSGSSLRCDYEEKQPQRDFACVAGPKVRSEIKDLEFHPPTCCDEWELGS